MLFEKQKSEKNMVDEELADKSDIKVFTSKMNYWQRVHLLMSTYYLDNPKCTKEDAYEYALDNSVNQDTIIYAMSRIINLGSILR